MLLIKLNPCFTFLLVTWNLKIVWPYDDEHYDSDAVFIATIDGVHCLSTSLEKKPSAKWCSHKFNGPGLAYEIVVDIRKSDVVWIKGPFPAGTPDVAIYCSEGGVKEKMPYGKRMIADRGYRGEQNNQLSTTRTSHQWYEWHRKMPPKVMKWQKSHAKEILANDVQNGIVTSDLNSWDVYHTHDGIFLEYEF